MTTTKSTTSGTQLHYNMTGFDRMVYVTRLKTNPFPNNTSAKDYPIFYQVADNSGRVILFLAKGYKDGPNEIVPFYTNGRMNGSFEWTLLEAFKLGIRDAVMYMENKFKS